MYSTSLVSKLQILLESTLLILLGNTFQATFQVIIMIYFHYYLIKLYYGYYNYDYNIQWLCDTNECVICTRRF